MGLFFQWSQFMGKWFEIAKYPNVIEMGQDCITSDFELNPNGTVSISHWGFVRL